MKQEDHSINNNFHHTYHQEQHILLQQQIMMHQQQQQNMMFPTSDNHQVISPPWSIPHQYPFNNNNHHHDPTFLVPPPPSSSSPYASFFNNNNNNNRRVVVPSLQFASSSYDGGPSHHQDHHLRIISETLQHHHHQQSPFGALQAELRKMTAQEIMEAKALAASKSHSEAERRRRERINNHLNKLRSLLPSTTKTDKASLLAEVIEHVKELKRQTSVIAETSTVPTESDELTVDASDEDGKFVIKASLCCEDRSDLLPELIKTLKSLRLRTLKADITTLGGRVKNVLFITAEDPYYSSTTTNNSDDDDDNIINHHINDDNDNDNGHYQQQQQYCISSIQEALKAVMEKSVGNNSNENNGSTNVKRQRTNMISIS